MNEAESRKDFIEQIKTMNIYEKMSRLSLNLQAVAKNLEIKAGANSYKAVSEADVLRAVKPLEEMYRIYSYPHSREILETGTLESIDYKGNVRKSLFERIKTVYRFVNIDNPSEYIDMTTFGDGIDSGDKSVGKAMTYADKYALLKAYKAVTGDDTDQMPSEELKKFESASKLARDFLYGEEPEAPAPRKPLSADLLKEAEALGMELPNVCKYLRKKAEELTDEDLAACIEKKKANLAKKKAAEEVV